MFRSRPSALKIGPHSGSVVPDMQPAAPPASLKKALLGVLRQYFAKHGIEADWQTLETAPLAALITSLAMICPFEPNEKQALVEAPDLARQGKLLVALMQMETMPLAASDQGSRPRCWRQSGSSGCGAGVGSRGRAHPGHSCDHLRHRPSPC